MQMKMSCMILETWLFGFGKVLDIFKGISTIPNLSSYHFPFLFI